MRLEHTSDLWWKNAIVYCLDVETFLDSDGDGVGDFQGLIRQIDYLAGLGVTCLWLMPFYPSPNRDDGYDVSDFYGVDPRLGDPGEFVELVRTANDRGIKVIVDLVVNHTSDEHPWFKAARADPRLALPLLLRLARRAFRRAQGHLVPRQGDEQLGAGGRLGAVLPAPLLPLPAGPEREQPGRCATRSPASSGTGSSSAWPASGWTPCRSCSRRRASRKRSAEDQHGFLRSLRAFATRRRGETMLLGEVNTDLKALARFFGDEDGDQLNVQFAFLLNQHLWLALAREDAEPLEAVIRSLPVAPPDNTWANFLRNHDELSLDKLTEPQRKEVFAAFGPRKDMQLYGHGLRRRTAAMLGGDGPRLRMAWSLMLSLPGTPVIFMGDEIGMGENLALPDRMSVRVPMQWSDERNGGFSSAAPKDLVRPVKTGRFGPKHVNVAAQRREPDSLLNFLERLIRRRKETPEFGWGSSTLIETAAPQLFAHRCEWQGSTVAAVHNLSPTKARATLGPRRARRARRSRSTTCSRSASTGRTGTGHSTSSWTGYGYMWLGVAAGASGR